MVCVYVGTGIGSGLLLDNRVYGGTSNYAGELGHIKVNNGENVKRCGCGQFGCLEAEVGGLAIAQKAIDLHIIDASKSTADLAVKAKTGNREAILLLENVAEMLWLELSTVASLLNPELIVISGGVSEAYDLLSPALRDSVIRHSWRHSVRSLTIEKSRLGRTVAAHGAAILAHYREGMSEDSGEFR